MNLGPWHELYDPKFGPWLDSRLAELRAKIEHASAMPVELMAEYDRLLTKRLFWDRAQRGLPVSPYEYP